MIRWLASFFMGLLTDAIRAWWRDLHDQLADLDAEMRWAALRVQL